MMTASTPTIAGKMLEHDWFDWPLPSGVQFGEDCWIYSTYAFLHCASRRPHPVRVGRGSGIYNGTFFELGPDGEVDIGDFCAIVGAIININNRLVIGDHSFIAHEVVIADSPWSVPPGPGRAARPTRQTIIGENVWIATRATILSGVSIGEGAIIGAATVVDRDIPPFAIAAGVPARIVGDARRR